VDLKTKSAKDNGTVSKEALNSGYQFRWLGARPTKSTEYYIENLIPVGMVGLAFGDEKSYKSLVATSIGVDIAMPSVKFHGNPSVPGLEYPVSKHGTVLYIATEKATQVETQAAARVKMRDANMTPLDVNFSILEGPINITDPEDVRKLAESMPLEPWLPPPALVIIDTVVFAIGDADESSATTATKAFLGAKELIKHCGGETTVLFLHHRGKNVSKGARGSSNWEFSAEFRLEFKAPKVAVGFPSHTVVSIPKMSGDAQQPPIKYQSKQFDFEQDGVSKKTLIAEIAPAEKQTTSKSSPRENKRNFYGAGMKTEEAVLYMTDNLGAGRQLTTRGLADLAVKHQLLNWPIRESGQSENDYMTKIRSVETNFEAAVRMQMGRSNSGLRTVLDQHSLRIGRPLYHIDSSGSSKYFFLSGLGKLGTKEPKDFLPLPDYLLASL